HPQTLPKASVLLSRGCRGADTTARHGGRCFGSLPGVRRRGRCILRSSAWTHKHGLLIRVIGRESSIAADLQSRGPAAGVVAAEHSGVDQEHLVAETRPDSPALLHGVSYGDVNGIISFQYFAYLSHALFVGPLVVAAEPQWAVNPHAEPVPISQELYQPGLALRVCRHLPLALNRNLSLHDGGHFLKRKKGQNHVLLKQILFGLVEGLDLVANMAIDGVQFQVSQTGINPTMQENCVVNFGQSSVSAHPLTVSPPRAEGVGVLDEAEGMPRHPLRLGDLHGLRKLG